jgi:NAD(P)-dependent dehydrogenase (short-subunit alcohol dehydrogenase family)
MLSQVALLPDDQNSDPDLFPEGVLDKDGQQEDRRPFNSWRMQAEQVPLVEFLEVLYINVVAPFQLCSRLKARMLKQAYEKPSFIVNVTAMEGNFSDPEKDPRHPHTNMAKAAVNMLTRTCAMEFRQGGIWMNAVDTGWITNKRPYPSQFSLGVRKIKMAIDEVDGAARICDPIFRAINDGEFAEGVLFKNYQIYPW